jgi:hypothetical protein
MRIPVSVLSTIAVAIAWTAIAAGFIWFLIRPLAEEAVLENQAASMHMVASYAVNLVESSLDERTALLESAAQNIVARPSEGEVTLRNVLERRPDALTARIHSAQVSDELLIQSTRRTGPYPEIPDTEWATYGRSDSTFISFVDTPLCDSALVATKTRFHLRNNEFTLTMFWDAGDICRILSRLPAGDGTLVSVNAGTDIRWKNWRPDSISLIDRQRIREPFHKAPLELDVAVPTSSVIARIRQSLWSMIALVLISAIVPGIRRLRKPR